MCYLKINFLFYRTANSQGLYFQKFKAFFYYKTSNLNLTALECHI
jgi:hypothetical protein